MRRPREQGVRLGGPNCRCCGQRLESEAAETRERVFVEIMKSLGEPEPAVELRPIVRFPFGRHPRRLGPYKVP